MVANAGEWFIYPSEGPYCNIPTSMENAVGFSFYGPTGCRMFLNTSLSASIYTIEGDTRIMSVAVYYQESCKGGAQLEIGGRGWNQMCGYFDKNSNESSLLYVGPPYTWNSFISLNYYDSTQCSGSAFNGIQYSNETTTVYTTEPYNAYIYCSQDNSQIYISESSSESILQIYPNNACVNMETYSFSYSCDTL
ncbi:hypothetical protein DLAC_07902 [Tieghemostelium lacteum]|uniref:Uncharacterized protein n=1 Tax=Tieghemostelium lacteum TaxID=361077 RepID=A0A151ZAN6_TIELA|nr:hypothetical protein DLAC_07902 [Tieghemostelium lacteum]|eukprot:KYQ91009.1 hypothetical protein DLAC_07902 [Tieghemostelium lacteum]